ncbi:MAG: MgtC/SapB family protein [Eubacteriales bacterium]|nr:MgtC/SapB family protein [Eubacteriales bacterium]
MGLAVFSEFGIISILFRLILSVLTGFVIGVNREKKKRGAGIRTHSLVCMSACLVMLTSEYISIHFSEFTGDITRLGAQVISGMGFIGAGTIIITKYNHVRGLTTAASLWATACIGLAFGIGFISAGLTAALLMLFILRFVEKIDDFMKLHMTVHDYVISFCDMNGFSIFLDEIRGAGIKIDDIEVNRVEYDDGPIVFITLESDSDINGFMLKLQEKIRIKMLNEL